MNRRNGIATVVVIPTYDEKDNIERIVARLHRAVGDAHVLIVDDASPDGTGMIADAMAVADGRVHVLHRPAKQGLGAAYLAGFAWAVDAGYDTVVEMDADGSHAPEQLPGLLHALGDADLVLGSRWVPGGSVHNWPLSRRVLSRAGNLYTRLALGIGLRDATGGYRAFRTAALARLDLDGVCSTGYCFQVDLAWRAVRAGLRVVEVPISFVERERGESKMSDDIVREALINTTRWGLRHRVEQLVRLGRSSATAPPRPADPGPVEAGSSSAASSVASTAASSVPRGGGLARP